MKEELRRLQKWMELGYEGAGTSIGIEAGGIRQVEAALLEQYRALKRDEREHRQEKMSDASANKLAFDMISDMSHFVSDKGVSEITGSTEQGMFHRRWEKIINSGMEKEDLTFLNPMASKMLPRNEVGVRTV